MTDTTLMLYRLGRQIRKIRRSLDLTQSQLVLRAGINRSYLSSLETGHRNASFLNLLQISHGLGIPLSELVRGLDDPEQEPGRKR